MIGRIVGVWAVVAVLAGTSKCQEPELGRLRKHVEILASPEFAGRRGEGAVKARDYLIAEFGRLGLAPLFDGSYTQDVTGPGAEGVIGVNVGARIDGSDPILRDRWAILAAHYDHLGVRGDVIYPGADDNASGVAMLLEVARSIAEAPEKPRRSLMLVGFDLEERGSKGEFGLRGSQYFCRNPPRPLDRVSLFVTADMIGRSLGGVGGRRAFAIGSESSPETRPWIARAAEGKPVDLGLLGADMLVIDRSDYGPFRSRKIPYLFFTTGENPSYHTPLDRPDSIDYPKLEAISQTIAGVVRESLRSDVEPKWPATPTYPLSEALTIRDVLKTLLEHREALKIAPYQVALMNGTIRSIDAIAARGAITPEERGRIVRAAQVILFTVF